MANEYGAEQIQVLEGIEHVRKRPLDRAACITSSMRWSITLLTKP